MPRLLYFIPTTILPSEQHSDRTSDSYLPDSATVTVRESEQNGHLNQKENEIQEDWQTSTCQEVKGFLQQLTSFPLEMDKKFTDF